MRAMAHRAPSPVFPPPWLVPPPPRDGPVAIVGGGVAGSALAAALGGMGRDVVIIERHGALAREGSGNPVGIIDPGLTPGNGPHARFHARAYRDAVDRLDRLGAWRGERGLRRHAVDAADAREQARLVAALGWPESEVKLEDAPPHGALWFGRAGCVVPPEVCAALAGDTPVRRGAVAALEAVAEGWRLLDGDGGEIATAATVVLAAGPWSPALAGHLPITANRGQITLLAGRPEPTVPLGFGGYLTPALAGGNHVLGATYDRWRDLSDGTWADVRDGDHARNLARLAAGLPHLSAGTVVGGRAALRGVSGDHLPLAGPVPRADFADVFAWLRHGPRPPRRWTPQPPWEPGLFVLGGLGSRGLQTAPLAADLVAAQITGAPWPLDADLAAALAPVRFAARALRKPR